MELILKTNNEQKIAKILALAAKLNVIVEKKGKDRDEVDRDMLKQRILDFKASGFSSFGDAAKWERKQREDRELPFHS